MGEYAEHNGERIKIGTCEEMFYLRYEDRNKVRQVEGSLDPTYEMNLFWRLPFPDEDNVRPGYYNLYNRGEPLIGFDIEGAKEHPGIIQARHACGILVNIPCLHGHLPEETGDLKVCWNGRAGWFFELSAVKNTKEGMKAAISCRFCHKTWSGDIEEIIECVKDTELKSRLKNYMAAGAVA